MKRPSLPALAALVALNSGCPHNELTVKNTNLSSIVVNLEQTRAVAQQVMSNIEEFCQIPGRISNPTVPASPDFEMGARSVYYSDTTPYVHDCIDHVLGHTWKNLEPDQMCRVKVYATPCDPSVYCAENSQIAIQCL